MCPHYDFDIWAEVRQGVCVVKIRVCTCCHEAEILGIDNEWRRMTPQKVSGPGVNEIAQ